MSSKPSDADPGWVPSLAAFALAANGLAHVLLAVQYITFFALPALVWYPVAFAGLLGAACFLTSLQVAQGRTWGAVIGLLISPMLGLLSLGVTIWAFMNASLALFLIPVLPAAAAATLLSPFAIAACRRASKAQAELDAQYGSGPFGLAR